MPQREKKMKPKFYTKYLRAKLRNLRNFGNLDALGHENFSPKNRKLPLLVTALFVYPFDLAILNATFFCSIRSITLYLQIEQMF